MIYFDTSYLLKCYIMEPGSVPVRELLEREGAAACCVFGRLEFSAAVKRCVREGRIDRRAAPTAFTVLEHDDDNGVWNWLPITPQLIESAAREIQTLPEGVFMRAGDALHVVCARDNGCTKIYSNDRHLLASAAHFGIAAVDVIP